MSYDRAAEAIAESIINGNISHNLDEMGMNDPVQAETIRLTLAVNAALTEMGEPDRLRQLVEARFR